MVKVPNNMSEKIDFTIITPSLNYGKYIDECLSSVEIQHGVVLEHLIFDAGSTDNTIEIISRYPEAHLVQEPDDGMSSAINKGFESAKGEWIMWLNADDRLKPGALKAILEFAAGKEADVLYSGWDFVDEKGDLLRPMTIFPFIDILFKDFRISLTADWSAPILSFLPIYKEAP